ncbi:MAG TPA: class I SAM-dependent methyltransferase [Thermoanaerobaculia bacterium]|nr:class I SAM-dependent methyltransferase [Thermoanaerobaculia bacterium]
MTVWNDATHSDLLAHTTWMANTAVQIHLNERATGDPARDWLSSWAHRWFVGNDLRVLVLGCGEGWLERALADWPFVARIDAVDFAEHAIARAREAAKDIPKIHYGVVDLNRDELPGDTYDVVVAHSVLHHVENLEHGYEQIKRAMRANATLVINEYVGPNRFQYSDDVLAIMNALLVCIAPGETRRRPTVEEMLASDPTEAVRAEEVLSVAERQFELLERKDLGGTLLQHLLFGIVQNFRFEVPRERSLLEMLCTIEAALVDSGRIPSDFVIAAARKRGAAVTKQDRPLPPRPEAANDVERDPLARLPVTKRLSGNKNLQPHHLRLLRLAVLSQQPHRANLFEENARIGRLGRSDPWEWLLSLAPRDPGVRALLETAATLAPA